MNKVMFSLGFVDVYWYTILILLAVIVGCSIAIKYAKKTSVGTTFVVDLIFSLIPSAIIGARIYYVVFNFDAYRDDLISILKIWEGGIAIYGAIIAGAITTFVKCRKVDKSFIETLDIIAPSLILGQAIGRWGNFFNGEAYGPVTSLDFLNSIHLPKFIIDGMYIDGNYYQPMFLYESILCLVGFIIIMIIRKKKARVGMQTATYFIWYGCIRLVIEHFRMDSLYLGSFKVSQIVSIIFIVLGLVIIIVNSFKNKNNIKEQVTNSNDRI